jgi:tripartite-type tricarboxylate transporter receptor subunit TctC
MTQTPKHRLRLKALAVLMTIAAAPLAANAWTNKPVRIIVPAPPGGTMDVTARILADAISTEIGQPAIVENKPGAGGAIGVQALNAAPPDGQTIMVTVSNILTEIPLVMKTSFDPLKDVKPVTIVARSTMVLVAAATVPANDVKGLIGHLKTSKGGQGSFASYTAGSSSHYAGLIFAKKAGLDLQHVPFVGSPPALQNVMGGQVDIMFDGMATSLPQIKGGKLKVYGVGSKTRSVHLPDVPTMTELGFGEIDFANWAGIIVSSKMPEDIVAKINRTVAAVAASPKTREKLIATGFEPAVSESPEKLAQLTKAEYDRNAQIVKAFNIQLNQ